MAEGLLLQVFIQNLPRATPDVPSEAVNLLEKVLGDTLFEVVPHSGMSLSCVAALLTESSAQCPWGRRVRQQTTGVPTE